MAFRTSFKSVPLPAGWRAVETVLVSYCACAPGLLHSPTPCHAELSCNWVQQTWQSPKVVASARVVAFDFDNTLAKTSLFRRGPDAWSPMFGDTTKDKLSQLHEEVRGIVCLLCWPGCVVTWACCMSRGASW